jgi:hypothetical protein
MADRIRARRAKLAAEAKPITWNDRIDQPIQVIHQGRPGEYAASFLEPLKPGDTVSIELGCLPIGSTIPWAPSPQPEAKPYILPPSNLPIQTASPYFAILPKEVATCLSCSSPATHGSSCFYCWHRHGESEAEVAVLTFYHSRNREAKARLARFDLRNRPKQTAESRELGKAHPWESDEGEP